LSLEPVADRMRALLEPTPVRFVDDLAGDEANSAVESLAPGEIVLLQNTRFWPGEKANDAELSRAVASLADVYVDDAFGAAHRAHASTVGIPEAVREAGRPAVAGMLVERELRFLGEALESPDRPFIAILGGAKISGKIDAIEHLLPRADRLLIGGAMANTFLLALGLETGESLVEPDRVEMARDLLERAADELVLPVDCVIETADEATTLVERDSVPGDGAIMDIGPKSVHVFRDFLAGAGTILWNGPMGVFEDERFRAGTDGVARAVADATAAGATSVVGGGDTASATRLAGLTDAMSHVSTGGGASLALLEGRTLPGIAALSDR
ncbi:MAG: phosphoglycerate kinase, partial [Gemmatimonadota bacterium]